MVVLCNLFILNFKRGLGDSFDVHAGRVWQSADADLLVFRHNSVLERTRNSLLFELRSPLERGLGREALLPQLNVRLVLQGRLEALAVRRGL